MSENCTQKNTKNTKKSEKVKLVPPPELVKCFEKFYILDRSDNYDEFLRELGVKRYLRIKAMESKPTVMLYQLRQKYVLSTSYPEGRYMKVSFRPGEEIHRWESRLNPTTSVFQVIGNKIIEEQTINDIKIVTEREFKKKELVITMELNNVKCYRWYTLADSRHSINTETSRRTSLWDATKPESTQSIKTMVESKKTSESEETEEENVCY